MKDLIERKTNERKSGQNDPLVRQLLTLINFLTVYHADASDARYKIGVETDLEKAKEIAIFNYPVMQGMMFSLTLKNMAEWDLPNDDKDIQNAMDYIIKNYKPKQSA